MHFLFTLFFTLVFVACGADTSDSEGNDTYVSESEDGSSSEEIATTTLEEEEYGLVCAEGKLCPGMTREDVLDLLGEPMRLKDYGFGHNHYWVYDNVDQGVDFCDSAIGCELRFDRDGILQEQNRFAVQYLDILTWNK